MNGRSMACLVAVAIAAGAVVTAQTRPAEAQPLAESVFKNIQVLKGIPVSEFMGTMGSK